MHGYRFSGTGSSYLGLFSDNSGTIGTIAEGWLSGGWNSFNSGFGAGIGTLSASLTAGTWSLTWTAARGGSVGTQTLDFGVGTTYPAPASMNAAIGYYSSNNNNYAIFHKSIWTITDPPPDTIL